jgi:dolichol-phosphate mannosyltransferase
MISVIIPVYNEEEMLREYGRDLFPAIDSLAAGTGEDFEILLVDDGSTDGSWAGISELSAGRRDVTGVRHEKNRGMGAAMKTGIGRSRGELLIFLDADLTFRPGDIRLLLEEYRRSPADCISGSPYLDPEHMKDVQPLRRFLGTSVNILYRLLLGRRVTSVSPIFRLYRREVFAAITPVAENFEINAEILAKMIFRGMTVREVPAALHKRRFGQSKARMAKSIRNHLKILWRIFLVRFLHREWT